MILITGATGFVGRSLHKEALRRGANIRAISRRPRQGCMEVGDITDSTDWSAALNGVDTVVHLAARVHILNDKAVDPLSEFRKTNVLATLSLARQAARLGVRRFVFISSIKVNGEETAPDQVYKPDDVPDPVDAYGRSKLEAEIGLREISASTGLEIVIIRPPLVYGPGVKANFDAMMRWLQCGIPLPFGAVTENRRSLVAADNLVDLILRATEHPAAASRVLLASDGEDVSTADLLKRLAGALHRPVRLVPLPPRLLSGVAGLVGRPNVARRLLGSLRVDLSSTCELLDWRPPLTLDAGLERTAQAFLASRPERVGMA